MKALRFAVRLLDSRAPVISERPKHPSASGPLAGSALNCFIRRSTILRLGASMPPFSSRSLFRISKPAVRVVGVGLLLLLIAMSTVAQTSEITVLKIPRSGGALPPFLPITSPSPSNLGFRQVADYINRTLFEGPSSRVLKKSAFRFSLAGSPSQRVEV